MDEDDGTLSSLITLIVLFYITGLGIAFYIRIRKIYLIRQIKNTGRVISLSSALITMLMQQLQQQQQQQQRQQISPSTGLPAPPPYTIETQDNQIALQILPQPNELPPPYEECETTTQPK